MRKIFVNGTFDILHRGHLEMLLFAKEQGDFLTVAVDTDERVKRLKGPTRPINTCADRMLMLMHLKVVDAVANFETDDDLRELISKHDAMV
jgi:D-beta-D-heptose 7-phosphate kinase/D-beta-D-heptose 1-phosphate adenosyltransferase